MIKHTSLTLLTLLLLGIARASAADSTPTAVTSDQAIPTTTTASFLASIPHPGNKAPDVAAIDRARILKAADAALLLAPLSITQTKAPASPAGIHDYYSNGDYWWPDPSKPDGLPYIQRDGQSNPANFSDHRVALRKLRDAVAALGAAYVITGEY